MSVENEKLIIGSIIFEYLTTTHPPKDKYYVVVGFSEDKVALGTVYINSEINPFIFTKEQIRKLHIPISAIENPFLKWDSYIDCSQIQERETADVIACLTSGSEKYGYISNLPQETLQTVIATLDTAFTIPANTKRKYKIRK